MRIIIDIKQAHVDAQGMKEALAMDCEKYGDGVSVVQVIEDEQEQMKIGG